MSYIKPTCNCGQELMIAEMVSLEKFYKVKKDGTRCRKPHETTRGFIIEENFWCSDCFESYAIDLDEKNRLIRSDKVS